MVHLSPLEVLRLPAYKQWLASFGEEATHVLVAESLTAPTPVMRKSAIVQVGAWGVGGVHGRRMVWGCRVTQLACWQLEMHFQHEVFMHARFCPVTSPRQPIRSACLPPPSQAKLNLVDSGLFPLHEGPPGEEAAVELPSNCVVRAQLLLAHLL